jgi:UDP-glucose 4-epimerase
MNIVIVTGGLGYIGSHIVYLLIKRGYTPLVIDNLSNSKKETIDNIHHMTNSERRIIFFEDDITDFDRMKCIFTMFSGSIKAVIHLAGLKSIEESIYNPDLYYDVNVNGSINIIRLSSIFAVKDFIFSGSASVYHGCMPIGGYHEDSSCNVITSMPMYCKSKRQVEQMMERYICDSSTTTRYTSLRYFNPIGNHKSGYLGEDINSNRTTNIFAMIFKSYCNNMPLNIYGKDYETPDGTCQRDFIHVMDLAHAHIKVLESTSISNQILNIFNIGTGKPSSVLELIHEFENASNHLLDVKYCERRQGDIATLYANVSKAERVLNWKASKELSVACANGFTRCCR